MDDVNIPPADLMSMPARKDTMMDRNDDLGNPGRRLAIGAAGGLVFGAAAGLTGGVMIANAARPPAAVVVDGAKRFAGKVVAITGATSGIGRATAEAFAREGAKVVFCGRREGLGAEVERGIRAATGEARYVRADVRREDDVAAFVDAAVTTFGGLDILVANAGITLEKPLADFTSAEWDDVVNTNLRGVFYAIRHAAPKLIERGGGQILVTSSAVANVAAAKRAVYAATKAGLVGLVRAAALDYADRGIRVNAILPGTTDTALVRRVAGMEGVPDAVWEIGAAQWAKSNVRGLKRMATAQEIAGFIVAMASPDLTYLTGAALAADGGLGVG